MKAWTRKFLSKKPTFTTSGKSHANTVSNSEKAEKKIKFPKELWMEISQALSAANWYEEVDPETMFAAGMAVGWAEKEESVK